MGENLYDIRVALSLFSGINPDFLEQTFFRTDFLEPYLVRFRFGLVFVFAVCIFGQAKQLKYDEN